MKENCKVYMSGVLAGFCNSSAVKFYYDSKRGRYEGRCKDHLYGELTELDPVKEVSHEEYLVAKIMTS